MIGIRETWAKVQVLSLTSCTILGRLLNLHHFCILVYKHDSNKITSLPVLNKSCKVLIVVPQ